MQIVVIFLSLVNLLKPPARPASYTCKLYEQVSQPIRVSRISKLCELYGTSEIYDNSGVYMKFWIVNFSYIDLIDRHGNIRKPIYCDN